MHPRACISDLLLIGLCIVTFLSACDEHHSNLNQPIIGTWKDENGYLTTYSPDGSVTGTADVPGILSSTRYVYTGSWEIKDGYLYETVTSSNDHSVVPVGLKSADKIVTLDNSNLIYISSTTGQRSSHTRVIAN